MPTRQNYSATSVLFLVLANAVVCAGETPDVDTTADFTRAGLLSRFDANQDGQLNAAERQSLHAAFGGIDVPLLPARPHRYKFDEGTSQLAFSQLRHLDNTPNDNPINDRGATLGRVLFYDQQLSRNNTIACASCHDQQRAFADPRRFSVGFKGGKTGRNSMGMGYLRFSMINESNPGFFWDERAATLEDQALMPIQDPIEMGMKLDDLLQKLRRLPYYPPLFAAAFRTKDITSERISQALAQFMRSMVSFDSRFDRAAQAAGGDYSRDFDDFTESENLGKSLFIDGVGGVTEIGCSHCHVPPTFGMPKSFNIGLALHYKDQGLGARNVPSNDPFTATNDGKFKASSLRNIALTAPYMHDGRFQTLEQVVAHYSSGVHSHANLGLAISDEDNEDDQSTSTSGFRLTRQQQSALVAFLKTLTDKALVTDPKFSDPFVRQKE